MTDLDDFTINSKVAEANGYTVAGNHCGVPIVLGAPGADAHGQTRFSPLTDWSQLGPLLEGRCIDLRTRLHPAVCYSAYVERGDCEFRFSESSDLKRAICLAIIAKHSEGEG